MKRWTNAFVSWRGKCVCLSLEPETEVEILLRGLSKNLCSLFKGIVVNTGSWSNWKAHKVYVSDKSLNLAYYRFYNPYNLQKRKLALN